MNEFLRPLPLLSVAVLALNDHLGKAMFHNWLTGKLSDVAGCFFLPLFVAALLECAGVRHPRFRFWVGASLTVAFFGALKVSPSFAAEVSRWLALAWQPLGVSKGLLLADPTDLLALFFVPASWLYVRRLWRVAPPLTAEDALVVAHLPSPGLRP